MAYSVLTKSSILKLIWTRRIGTDLLAYSCSFSSRDYYSRRRRPPPPPRGYLTTTTTIATATCKNSKLRGWAIKIRGGGGSRAEFSSASSNRNVSSSSSSDIDDDGGVVGRDYLTMSDEQLMRQCQMDTFKASGPGGQHRNKRESAVRLKHLPTGIVAQAVEDRSQHSNRASALSRLRILLALKGILWCLTPIHLLKSFFKYFLPDLPSRDHTAGHRLDQIIPNLFWDCKLY